MNDPLPYDLEGDRYATNNYPSPGWGEFYFNPRHGYDDHEVDVDMCEACEINEAHRLRLNAETLRYRG